MRVEREASDGSRPESACGGGAWHRAGLAAPAGDRGGHGGRRAGRQRRGRGRGRRHIPGGRLPSHVLGGRRRDRPGRLARRSRRVRERQRRRRGPLQRRRPAARARGHAGQRPAHGDRAGGRLRLGRAERALRQPALAATLAEIADFGWRAFYDGPVARRVCSGMVRLGVPLVPVDLARHAPEVTAPLRARHRAGEILTAPPNSQGLLLAEILAALECLHLPDPLGSDAGALAELFRLVSRDRDRHLGDPRWTDVPVEELLSPAHAKKLAEAAASRAAAGRSPAVGGNPHAVTSSSAISVHQAPGARAAGDTVAVVAMDADGYAVSLIQSVFHAFGSGLLDSETGLILHNRGAFFSLDPSSPNRLEPGKRPAHTLMPVLVREAGRIAGAHGTMGGKAQPQIHTHLLLNLEAGRSPAAALDSIATAGLGIMAVADLDEEVGHGQLVRRTPSGELLAATDPRADGQAAA